MQLSFGTPTLATGDMGEERKLVSVLFADIVGSTALGEERDPEVVRALMARYFARMSEIAEAHGGTVEKFIGDAVMVVFGVPRVHEDDAERAVRAGLAMRDAVAEVGRGNGFKLDVRVGVNTGRAVAGSGRDDQFLVTGDVVNVAARLQQGADAGEVVIGELTAGLTRDAIEQELRPPLVAKGKSQPIVAFRATGARTAVPERTSTERLSLVGRERELAALLKAFAAVRAEHRAWLVTVLGSAGIGKSRLVDEAIARLAKDVGVRSLRGRCLPYGAGVAYWPLIDVVRDDARIELGDGRDEAVAKLLARLKNLLPEDTRAVIEVPLKVLLGLDHPAKAMRDVPPERVGAEIATAFRRLLAAVAERTPTVVTIDDLQWADAVVIDAIHQVIDELVDVPLLFLCMARRELIDLHPSWAAGRENALVVSLEPLSRRDTDVLVNEILTRAPAAHGFGGEIARRSEGNPLFCEQLARALMDDMATYGTATPASIRVPETIEALLAARIDTLAPGEKRVLHAASVLGEQFDLRLLLALLPGQVGTTPETLVRKAFFVRDAGMGMRFKHLLVRDVAYDTLPKAERADLHDRIGRILENQVGDRVEEFSEILAFHAMRALALSRELAMADDVVQARAQWALRWTVRAADRAASLHLLDHAETHYGNALSAAAGTRADVHELARIHASRGRVLDLATRHEDALASYEQMERLGAEHGDIAIQVEGLVGQATLRTTATALHDEALGEALLERALRVARTGSARELIARVRWNQVILYWWLGRLEAAREAGEESIAIARAEALREQLALTLNDLSRVYADLGDMDRAGTAVREAADIFAALGNDVMRADNASTHATLCMYLGRYEQAIALATEACRTATEIGNVWGRAYALSVAADAHFRRGELGPAIAAGEEARSLAASGGYVAAQVWSAYLGATYAEIGEAERAEQLAREAALIADQRLPSWRPIPLAELGRCATVRGALDEAERLVGEAKRQIRDRRVAWASRIEPRVALAEIEVALGRGDAGRAAALATEAVARARARATIDGLADLEWQGAQAFLMAGDTHRARETLDRAEEVARRGGEKRVLWRILASRAAIEPSRKAALNAEAVQILQEMAASLPTELAERFRAQPAIAPLLGARLA